MRLIACYIVLLPALFYFLFRNRKKNFFAPKTAFTFLYVIKVIIGVFYLSNPETITEENLFLRYAVLDDDIFIKYCVLQSISYFLVLFGIWVMEGVPSQTFHIGASYNRKMARAFLLWGYFFVIIGIIGFSIIMKEVGGVVYFFSNLHLRRSLVGDLDFANILLSFLSKGVLLILFSKRYSRKNINLWNVILIVSAGIMSGLGGRKELIMLAIESVFIYNFVVKEVHLKKLLRPSIVISIVCIFIFFTTYSKLRREGAMDDLINDPIAFYQDNASDSFLSAIAEESYVPFYISIIMYFDNNSDYWNGDSFKGLLTAIIPSSLFPQKPPVDDGMYLYSIAHGRPNVKPVMPAKALDGTSWPLETFGSMYANFGVFGVFIGMLLIGMIIGWSYRKMVLEKFSFLWLLMYIHILFSFEISTLRIFQTFIFFISIFVISFIVKKIH